MAHRILLTIKTLSCCVMQISYIGDYLVFGVSIAMIAYTKEPCLTPTYFTCFPASLLLMENQEVQNF